jgi:hypothetical protein
MKEEITLGTSGVWVNLEWGWPGTEVPMEA